MTVSGLELSIRDLVDLVVVTGLSWLAIRYLRRTRARAALLGLLLLGVVYLTARWLELTLTAAIFQGFFAVLVLVLVVVFQSDLRRLFEQLGAGVRDLRRARPGAADDVDLLVRTVGRMASARIGALIVVTGREPLEPHLEGGIALSGRLSEPLLLSLFDASSPGHDGAVVVSDGRVERFAVHLPLSSDHAQIGPGGTRHAAALGLAERCDALCIVVSEERGTVSVARDGRLRALENPGDLARVLRSFRAPPETKTSTWRDASTWIEVGSAIALAVGLWALLVPGASQGIRTVPARVVVERLPRDFVLESIEPERVQVTLSGRRRDLLLAPSDVAVRVDGLLVKLGRRTFELEPDKVIHPPEVEVSSIVPARVKITVRAREEAAPPPG